MVFVFFNVYKSKHLSEVLPFKMLALVRIYYFRCPKFYNNFLCNLSSNGLILYVKHRKGLRPLRKVYFKNLFVAIFRNWHWLQLSDKSINLSGYWIANLITAKFIYTCKFQNQSKLYVVRNISLTRSRFPTYFCLFLVLTNTSHYKVFWKIWTISRNKSLRESIPIDHCFYSFLPHCIAF